MKYKMLYNFYMFSIDILYNMIYNKIIKGTDKQPLERMEKNMKRKLYGQFITEMGCCVYATITVNEDYTMNEVVREVKRLGYKAFLIEQMKRFVYL